MLLVAPIITLAWLTDGYVWAYLCWFIIALYIDAEIPITSKLTKFVVYILTIPVSVPHKIIEIIVGNWD